MRLKSYLKPLKNLLRKSIIILTWAVSLTILACLVFLLIDWGLKKIISVSDLTNYEYRILTTGLFAGISTTLALLAALFRDEIRGTWKYAVLRFEQQEKDGIYEHSAINEKEEPRAFKYTCQYIIHNSGTIAAKECCIKIESITVKPTSIQTTKEIEIKDEDDQYMMWTPRYKNYENILPTDKFKMPLITILHDQGATYGGGKSSVPVLNAGDIQINNEHISGTWTIVFALYSESCNPIKKKIQVVWNGKWANRKTEMMDNISVKEIS